MRTTALGAIFGICAICSGTALAQDVTYPFEDNQPAAPAKQPGKPKAKSAAPAVPSPTAKPAESAEQPKQAVAKPQSKPEPKAEPTRDGLTGIAAEERETIGWSVVLDPATGIRLGLPVKWMPQSKQAGSGTHWSSRHGDIQVQTFRIKAIENLSALFEKEKREPANRKIESSALKGDGFTVTGLQGLKKFGVRAQLKNGELRGYTVLFDQAVETIVAPVTAAMAGVFSPFPDSSAPIATLAKPVDYGTGLIVSADGHILTDRRLADNCSVIAVAGLGNAERVAVDRSNALALLRVYGKRDLTVARISDTAAAGDFTLVGIPDPHNQDGGKKLAEVKVQLGDGNAIRLRESVPLGGFSGAAALDGNGRVLGMMETRNAQLASAEVGLPPVRLVPASAIRDFLLTNNVTASQASADSRAAVVRIICVSKK